MLRGGSHRKSWINKLNERKLKKERERGEFWNMTEKW